MSADDHRLAVSRIQRHIAAGDIYQANLTQRFESETEMSGREIYRAFARTNPAPFSAYLQFPAGYVGGVCGGMPFPGMDVISCSPERFWKKRGAWIETRPIKGTIARGDTVPADRNNLRQLLRSEKDRAELLMITDLERNDLGRVADVGSVHVRALRRPRSYESVWHLESTITARVAAHIGWHDVMRAMFPGGSITGAPKRRAVEILREIETVPRGVYCGAIGWVDAVGDADFSIAIRTAIKVGDTLSVFGGGGIVADSDPGTEYEESLVKIAPMLNSVQPSAHPFSNTDHLDAATFVEVP